MIDCTPTRIAPSLTVVWVNGQERLVLFSYDTGTRQFVETSAGLASGRAMMVNGPSLAVTLQGVVRLAGTAGRLQVAGLSDYGGTATGIAPRLEFMIGTKRVASLTAAELRVSQVTEAATLTTGGNQFEFLGGGGVVAVLTSAGLVVLNVAEEL